MLKDSFSRYFFGISLITIFLSFCHSMLFQLCFFPCVSRVTGLLSHSRVYSSYFPYYTTHTNTNRSLQFRQIYFFNFANIFLCLNKYNLVTNKTGLLFHSRVCCSYFPYYTTHTNTNMKIFSISIFCDWANTFLSLNKYNPVTNKTGLLSHFRVNSSYITHTHKNRSLQFAKFVLGFTRYIFYQ